MQNSKHANLCRHLVDAAQQIPTGLAVAVQQRKFNTLRYQEIDFFTLNQRSDQIAFAFNQYGIKSGDKAVLMVTPSIDFFAITFALFKAGIIPILVDPGMGTKNLKQCFNEAAPDVFIGIPKAHIARRLFGWGKSTIKHNITVAGLSFWGGSSLNHLLKKYVTVDPYPMVGLDAQQMAAILFTSGSTGSPKGVIYSHAMFEAQIELLKHDYGIINGERDLATFPLFSLFGPALGMASIVPDMDASKPITVNPDNIFAAIEKYQCTNLFANPALIERLGQAGIVTGIKLNTLKRVISAGAPATLPSIERFTKLLNKGVEIINSYGATESLPISKIGSLELLRTEAITDTGGGICVGLPVQGTNIAIIEDSDLIIAQWQDGLNLPAYEIGEIVVSGPQVSRCYYNRENATAASKIFDGDNVRHRMGDLGYLDEHARLWMCGRKSHAVHATFEKQVKSYFSIPCERIFNTHSAIKRSALVAVEYEQQTVPLLCIELLNEPSESSIKLFNELTFIAKRYPQTVGIKHFLIHSGFPMDIRHNAKIYREKLAVWAQQQVNKRIGQK
ncbi:olefin beta-lactone synthetase [Psychromonas antarctica]|uniref:olefin beta-lactone synthetase n=1 Tax=Psychromonas antarctica TaxID=67573 RepID=UPI001EE96951|nr:fatty acid CoA ligase family protein [Psychromonas antarctica]MCG6200579.1 AMP-binding protein [Psychromonas antarctica]